MGTAFDRYIKQPDPSQKLWRYMDLSKFLSLLSNGSLFFAQWRTLNDPMEGLYNFLEDDLSNPPELRLAHTMLTYCYLINCWVASEHESLAMWKLYLSGNDGVAIQSTVSGLHTSLEKSVSAKELTAGLVNYFYGEPPAPGDQDGIGTDILIFYKRQLFSYEQEYRVLHVVAPVEAATLKGGKHIPVDLRSLTERVYISPNAKPWLKELLSSLTRQQYGLDFEYVDSELQRKPFRS